MFDQLHPDLRCQLVTLACVARFAGGDDVRPCRKPATSTRDDVIVGELLLAELHAAVLAAMFVPLVDAAPREFHIVLVARHLLDQATDGRKPDGDRWRPRLFFVALQDVDLADVLHGDALLPRSDLMDAEPRRE